MTNPLTTVDHVFQHGVFMNIFGLGVLLTGESGVGKSELALILIDRGHQLIADDMVEFFSSHQKVVGRAPQSLQNLLELRGLGIFNIKQLLGEHTIKPEHTLSYIIHLKKVDFIQRDIDLKPQGESICDVLIPRIVLPFTQLRRFEIIIETLIKHVQQTSENPVKPSLQNHFFESEIHS